MSWVDDHLEDYLYEESMLKDEYYKLSNEKLIEQLNLKLNSKDYQKNKYTDLMYSIKDYFNEKNKLSEKQFNCIVNHLVFGEFND